MKKISEEWLKSAQDDLLVIKKIITADFGLLPDGKPSKFCTKYNK